MNEEFKPTEIEETPYRRFSPTVIAWILVGFGVIVVLGVYFAVHSYQNWKEDQTVTVEKITEAADPDENSYDTYVSDFRVAGVDSPAESYVYNVEIPEEGRAEIDPLYDDPYIGYEENKDIHAALWKVDDGNLLFLYEPNSKKIIEISEWSDQYEDSLSLEKLRGEKAVLTLETMKETNPEVRKANIEKIQEMNDELLTIVEKINASLTH